jgi:hypothetical protein
MPWRERVAQARAWLDAFGPDWISLQFVPFGFHPKGLCFGLGKHLAAMNAQASWHVMFHELWLGLEEGTPVKHRIWGALQRRVAMDVMARLRPRVVHTQAAPHRIVLQRNGITAAILPLFGNLPCAGKDGWSGLLEPLVTKTAGARLDRGELYLAGVLGRVPPEWSLQRVLEILGPLTERSHKRLVLVFFGKNLLPPAAIEVFNNVARGRADLVFAGERTDVEMSEILQAVDLGLATTPGQMVQKSGAVAAMLEHGLTVLTTRDDWRLRGSEVPQLEAPGLLWPEQFRSLSALPERNIGTAQGSSVEDVASRMIAALAQNTARLANSPATKVTINT